MASDGKNLHLYQAVVDARKLLDELSDPETSVSENCHTLSTERIKCLIEQNLNQIYHLDHTYGTLSFILVRNPLNVLPICGSV